MALPGKGEVSPDQWARPSQHRHRSSITHPPHTSACLPHACTHPPPLSCQEFLLSPIPLLLGLDAPEAAGSSSSQQQQPYSFGSFGGNSSSGGGSGGALALPGAGAGGLMLQAWNFTSMLTGGGSGGRGQNPAAGGTTGRAGGPGGQGGGGSSAQQGGQAAAAVVEDAISRAQQLRDQLYGQQLMQGFDPQELRMVREAGTGGGRGVVLVGCYLEVEGC